MGIDECAPKIGHTGILVGKRRGIDHKHTNRHTNLRCCKAYTLSNLKRFVEVGNELWQIRVVGRNVGSYLTQYGTAYYLYGVNHSKNV